MTHQQKQLDDLRALADSWRNDGAPDEGKAMWRVLDRPIECSPEHHYKRTASCGHTFDACDNNPPIKCPVCDGSPGERTS